MLESGVIAVTLFVAAVQCGVVPTYQQAPLTTIAKISSPLPYAAPRLTYASSSPILPKYTQVAYAAQAPAVAAPVAYATQYAPAATLAYTSAKLAAPVTYASHAAPVAYAAHAPAVYSHAPAPVAYAAPAYAKVAAPVAYHAAPIAKAVVPAAVDTDYDPNPSYNYAYDIQDALTGDSKNQQESRQGDVVQGSYSLTEPDGTRRTVEYTADPVNGFNAVVHREPAAVQKAIVAAPAYAKVAAPVAYASHAPIVAAHAPVAHYSSYH